MLSVFTKSEVDILLAYIRKCPESAGLIGDKALTALRTGEFKFQKKSSLNLPDLPAYFSANADDFSFNSKGIVNFFVAVHHLPKDASDDTIEKFNELNALNFGTSYVIKAEHLVDYYIILLVELRGMNVNNILSESKNDFWTNYHAFINVFQFLTLSVDQFCEVLKLISIRTEGDMAAGSIYNLIKSIPDSNFAFAEDLYKELLVPTNKLIAKYIGVLVEGLMKYMQIQQFESTILQLFSEEDADSIIVGLTIVNSLNFINQPHIALNLYKKIVPFLDNDRNEIKFAATLGIISLSKGLQEAMDKLLELSQNDDIQYRFPISEYIWRSSLKESPSVIVRQISLNLASHNCDNSRMMDHINWHIIDCLKMGEKDYVVSLFETWLKNGQNIKSFEHVISSFIMADFIWFCSIITPWFVSADRYLIEALMEITAKHDKRVFILDSDVLNSLTEKEILRAIGCIIGYIYMKEPLASLTLSILDSNHLNNQAGNIETLFVDYICYTYPSTLKDYIQPALKNSTGMKKKVLQNIVKRVNKYFEDLKSLPQLKELQGSDTRRRNYNKSFNAQRSRSMDAARNGTIFNQIAKNIIMRAGATWFSKSEEGYSNESKLQPMEFSFEMPRAEYIDPATFEIFRTRMRFEALAR